MQTDKAAAGQPRNSSFWADLRVVLAERDFRKLFAIRLASQAGGGVFSAGFTAYVFFSASTFPSPAAAAEAFTVLYLPFSLIGPFVGVFIDRWSRRQILLWAAALQAAMVVVASLIVASGQTKLPFYICVLAILGAGRFFGSAISAATPHVVAADKLVMANAVAPTLGTLSGIIGGLVGLVMRLIVGGGHGGSAATFLVSAVFYVIAGLIAARIARATLGPAEGTARDGTAGEGTARDGTAGRPGQPALTRELAAVAVGLWDALRHLRSRRKAGYALGAVAVHHLLYSVLLVQGLLLYRNYLYPGGNGNAALGHATWLVATSAVGYGLAAVVTPVGTKRVSLDAWIGTWLVAGAVATLALGPTFSNVPFLVMGLVMGLSAQCVKICVDTTVQQQVDDEYMGRVFSVYDMLYNITYVIGPALAIPFLPDTGKSYLVVVMIGIAYLVAGLAYLALTRRPTPAARSPRSEPTTAARR